MTTPQSPSPELSALRGELAKLDESILGLVAQRQAIASEIGRVKAGAGRSTRDFGQEKEVIGRVRRIAIGLGIDPDFAEHLTLLLIRASLTVQEHDRVLAGAEGEHRRVLIIGGAGKMGRWFARFLHSQGFTVEIADPAGPVGEFPHLDDWHASKLEHDILIVAAPLRQSAAILEEIATRRPRGIVFDVGSLKTPLRPALTKLVEAGVLVTSIHPMFGPDTDLLSGRHVILVDVGVPEATQRARELFSSTMAVLVEMDLDAHDRTVAFILGLSHALNIAFLAALADSGEHADTLKQLSSTTFDAQLEVARRVAGENPHLYFEIQSLNEYGMSALNGLTSAIDRVRSAVQRGDEAEFVTLMQRGADYVANVQPR